MVSEDFVLPREAGEVAWEPLVDTREEKETRVTIWELLEQLGLRLDDCTIRYTNWDTTGFVFAPATSRELGRTLFCDYRTGCK